MSASWVLTWCFCAMCHLFLFWHLVKEITWQKTLGNDINCEFTACINKGVPMFKDCPRITFLNVTVEIFPDCMLLLSKQSEYIGIQPNALLWIMSQKKIFFLLMACKETGLQFLDTPLVIWICVVEQVWEKGEERCKDSGGGGEKKREALWIQIPPCIVGRACINGRWMQCLDHSEWLVALFFIMS